MEFSLQTGSRVGLRERSKLRTQALDDERSTRLRTGPVRTGPVRSWRYFCVLKRVQVTSLTTMQMGSHFSNLRSFYIRHLFYLPQKWGKYIPRIHVEWVQ